MNEEEALALVSETLKKNFAKNPEIASKVSSADLEESSEDLLRLWRHERETANTPGRHGAFLGFRYVIPDQDLQVVECATSVLTTVAGVGFLLDTNSDEFESFLAASCRGLFRAIPTLDGAPGELMEGRLRGCCALLMQHGFSA